VNISGTTILITGATGGIGAAVAEVLATEKCHLQLAARKKSPELEARLLGAGAASVKWHILDFLDRDSFEKFCKTITAENIDVLFNNAGLLTGGLLENQSAQDIENMFSVNLVGLVLLTRALLPGMISRGSGLIINNASISGIMNFPASSTYAASKAGVIAFHRSLEVELATTGIETLLLITPGIKTKMFDQIDTLYGPHLSLGLKSITAESYADQILTAIKNGDKTVTPGGIQWVGMQVAQKLPGVFRWAAGKAFRR